VNSSAQDQCSEWKLLLHGFIDGELDAAHSLQLEQHLAACSHCSDQLERLQLSKRIVTQEGVRWRTPDHVRARILAAISRESTTQDRLSATAGNEESGRRFRVLGFVQQWMFVPSLAALAASLFLVVAPLQDRSSIQDEVVAGHVRSLLVDHLTDVATSDQHTVKPWFNGKIDFAPPVLDLAPQGFPLVGGRIDYIGGRVVAALVYRRQGHLINVFAWPAPPTAMTATTRDGYNMTSWSKDGLSFWAISDVGADQLNGLRDSFAGQTVK
jgi:anti-sigma factor RsiW